MKRSAAVLLALALCVPLAACGDDPGDDLGEGAQASVDGDATQSPVPGLSPAPSAVAEPSSTTPPAPPSGQTPTGQDDDPEQQEAFPADTAVDEQEASGGPLTVTAVRVAHHDGYDRVVFELAGQSAGQPGWRVEYVDDPTQQGSGDPVEVDGAGALSVTITGTGYPFDTGQQEVSEAPALPGDLGVVTDLELGGVFEGHYEAFIGTSAQTPFRVFRLADPARVVVDVRTP